VSYKAHQKELQRVLKLSPTEQYQYFLGKVTDWKEVWSIGNDEGWSLAANDAGRESVPVWPAAQFAEASCNGPWQGNKPKTIPLDAFMEKGIPGMIKDGRMVAVFPTPAGKGVVVEPAQLLNDLREVLEAYGEDDEDDEDG
jgi:hypothetical protein